GALPRPERPRAAAAVRPRTPVEEALQGIWAEVLGVEGIGRGDNFFALGGHSLLATRVLAHVRGRFGVPLGLCTLFQQPTIAGLAALIEGGMGAASRIPEAWLSFAQHRLWLRHQADPESALF